MWTKVAEFSSEVSAKEWVRYRESNRYKKVNSKPIYRITKVEDDPPSFHVHCVWSDNPQYIANQAEG